LICIIDLQKEEVPMFGIGSQELMVILLVVFLIFGPKRLPELGGSLGRAIRGFKNGMKDEDSDRDSKA
jgi:sec-independent protein translocase protein TatA